MSVSRLLEILCLFVFVTYSGATLVTFPLQFRATVGTTIPLLNGEPIAQSGAIFYDALNNRFRVDSFWMNTSHSIIANFASGDYSVLNNGQCRRVKTAHVPQSTSMPKFGVPDGFMRHAELYAVRGVPTTRFSGVERGEYLLQVDYFVRNMTMATQTVDREGTTRDTLQVPSLWRMQSQRSRRKELRGPDGASPNWRWFGQPMNELVVAEESYMNVVDRMVENVPITMDFFDFVPVMPDPNLFVPPTSCEIVSDDAHDDTKPDFHVFAAQRLLVDLSFFTPQGTKAIIDMRVPIAQENEENEL